MQIISAGSGRWRDPAMRMLTSGQPRSVRETVDPAELDELELGGLLAALSGSRLIGAALFVLQSDRTGHVWPPVVVSDPGGTSSADVADALLAEVARRLDAEDAWLGQTVLEPDRTADREHLQRAGFGHLADLVLMERPLASPLPDIDRARLDATCYEPGRNDDRFAGLLRRTYVGTLDCPGLDRWRTPEEALASHRLAGEFDPHLWRIHSLAGIDVGLLLATAHPAESAREIVYMGVVPEARGRGHGRAMLIDALRAARDSGCATIRLAVDAANVPARKLYDGMGFVATGVRCVHGRPRAGGGLRA
ncbi:MAG: GNAT family N-acetyltransferase [Planctomycetales bacterium]